MDIRVWFIGLVFLYTTISLGTNQRDSIAIDTRWNRWHVESVSSNGDWTFLYQIFTNDISKNRAFVVNTDSKKRIEVTGVHNAHFTTSNILLGTNDRQIVEVDLNKNAEQVSLGKVSQYDWLESEQILCFTNEEDGLILKKYTNKGAEVIWHKKEVLKYYLSPFKTKILYQKAGSLKLYLLDLSSLKEQHLFDLEETLPNSIQWNFEGNSIAVAFPNSKVLYIDIEVKNSKVIELPNDTVANFGIALSFFDNDDLYISYQLQNAIKDPVEEYLDIWNGNDRDLKNKVRPRQEGELKAFVYKQQGDTLLELPRSEKQEYFNMGVSNYLLVYEPLELQDYSKVYEDKRYRLLQLEPLKELGTLTITDVQFLKFRLFRSPNGTRILYPNGKEWEVYDFQNHSRVVIPYTAIYGTPAWTADSKSVFYTNQQGLWVYDLEIKELKKIIDLEVGASLSIIKTKNEDLGVLKERPLFFSVRHSNYHYSIYSWYGNKLRTILKNSPNLINIKHLDRGISEDGKTLVWTEENFNLPPTVKVYRKGKVKVILEPELPKELYAWQKQKVIHYKDKYGVDLAGVLWYPKDFDSTKKYPMVTYIYERQGANSSVFDVPTLYNQHGFNRVLLNEQGYFVFQPDSYVSEEGPGLSASECVTKGIQTITHVEPSIDKTKLGLIGHSFGGYKVSFILGNTDLFAVGVSGAGAHDLINFNYEYNYYRKMPNCFMLENEQSQMRQSFAVDPLKYYKNSSIHFAQNYETPLLLWTGMEDYNVHWENTRHMYVALQRYKRPVVALFYKNEGHALSAKKSQIDLTYKVLDWFEFYLEEKKNVSWINRAVDYTIY